MFNFFQQQKQQGYARPLHPYHWQALEYVRNRQRKPKMELKKFMEYWEVSREELAKIYTRVNWDFRSPQANPN